MTPTPMARKRGITLKEAARYCGLSISGFQDWVSKGRVPGPMPGTKRWDLKAIDLALDNLSGLESELSPFDQWKRGQSREGHNAGR